MQRPLLLLLLAFLPLTPAQAATETPGSGVPVSTLPTLPAGLLLPVSLTHTLHAGRTHAGLSVVLHTTQRIPLGNHTFLPRNTALHATILTSISTSSSTTLSLKPVSLTFHGTTVPLTATALALANFVAVQNTAIPADGSPDRGNPDPANWTTAQVGGGQIMRSGWVGPLINHTSQTVGSADFWGVYTLPPSPGTPPRALGPFSAQAHGLFGYDPVCRLSTTGATATVTCSSSSLVLRRGDIFLLQITGQH